MDNFSESAVLLGSEDGLHTTEQSIEQKTPSERQKIADAQAAAQRSGLTLAEQLALNRQIKEDLMKDKHNPYKPPAQLSSDDKQYLQEVAAAERAQQRREQQAEQEELSAYQRRVAEQQQAAVKNQKPAVRPVPAAAPSQPSAPLQSVSKLRLVKRTSHGADHLAATDSASKRAKLPDAALSSADAKDRSARQPVPAAVAKPSIAALVQYGSSEDESDEDR